jgi:ATP-dependent Clp protease ATP-binding subunit ClpA
VYETLVSRVEGSTADPLERIGAAVEVREAVAADADKVMDYFVGLARGQGLSWTVIGDQLGVSRQAARQRFAGRVPADRQPQPSLSPLRPRLHSCLVRADREAHSDGSSQVETHHLLVGLFAEGVAATILDRLGLTADQVREAGHRLFGPTATTPGQPVDLSTSQLPDQPLELSAEARCALDYAIHIARATCDEQHEYVGTEHLLAAIALDPGSRARRVLNDLNVDAAVIKRELATWVTVKPRRTRRNGGKIRNPYNCSFCGRAASEAELVSGPNVWICPGCVSLAAEIVAGRTWTTPS